MLRILAIIGLLPLLLLASPASALTKAEKEETCKFGADDQKLEGAPVSHQARCQETRRGLGHEAEIDERRREAGIAAGNDVVAM